MWIMTAGMKTMPFIKLKKVTCQQPIQDRRDCPSICNTEEIRKLKDHPICLRFTGPGRGRLKRNNFVETAKYRSCI